MTAPINNSLTGFYDEVGNPPKRVKIEEENLNTSLDDFNLAVAFLPYVKISDLIAFACLNKSTYELAQKAFLERACEIGYKVKNSGEAHRKIITIYHNITEIIKKNDIPTTFDDYFYQARNQTLLSRCAFLMKKQVYDPEQLPLLELLELKNSWKNARVEDRELTQEEDDQVYKALCYASYYGRPKLIKFLLENKANSNNERIPPFRTDIKERLPQPIESAIVRNDIKSIKRLLAHDEEKDFDWEYAFGHHGGNFKLSMVKFLLRKGARVANRDLIAVGRSGSLRAMKLLMEKGATFNQKRATRALEDFVLDSTDQTENFVVDKRFRKVFNFLLRQGAETDNDSDESLLAHVTNYGKCIHTDLIKYLVRKGADLSKCDEDGMTPLMNAVFYGRIEIVRFLLESGADADQRREGIDNVDGLFNEFECVLTMACYTKSDKMTGWTPNSNNPEIVKLLLDYGADPVREYNLKYCPLDMARKRGLTEIVKLLEDKYVEDYGKLP